MTLSHCETAAIFLGDLKMRVPKILAFLVPSISLLVVPAHAETIVSGRVILAEGHEQPGCRRIYIRKDTGEVLAFRVPETAKEDSIVAVALTALTSGLTVDVGYTPGLTTGCGPEYKVQYLSLRSAGY